MHLDRFRAEGVHGYLKFNIKFRKDLTFLTGINGSGKTTALNAIQALITPDLATLSNLRYRSLSVDLLHAGEKFTIAATGAEDTFSLHVSGTPDPLVIRRYPDAPEVSPARQVEHEAEYFRELSLAHASHPVIRLISSLPTPMFLGLDRRARFEVDERRRIYPARLGNVSRNVFSSSLTRSLHDAADLAATRNRDALISSARIGDELRRDMLLSLLTLSPEDFGNIQVPTDADKSELKQIRQDLETFPQIFNLPRDDVRKRIVPFLDALEKAVSEIPKGKALEILGNENTKPAVTGALLKWSANRSQLRRIQVISDFVKRFNERRAELQEPVHRYTRLVNDFLNDSGKSISFDKDGYPYVAIEGVEGGKQISSLSSGEAQIFVILTHLSFNSSAQSANIFIIDEPELSLHVLWQEIFVDSVLSANPNIQYIMATHSPSIILDKTSQCVDISKNSGRKARGKVLT
jgi:predicted ATPase